MFGLLLKSTRKLSEERFIMTLFKVMDFFFKNLSIFINYVLLIQIFCSNKGINDGDQIYIILIFIHPVKI